MRPLTHIAALALALSLMAAPAFAAEPAQAKARVTDAVRGWEAAVQKQAETRSRYQALEQRISTLKKESAKATFTGSSELDKLLKQSVGADEALRAEDRAVES